jgi:hypothetical protein
MINERVNNYLANGTFAKFFLADPADETTIYEAEIKGQGKIHLTHL